MIRQAHPEPGTVCICARLWLHKQSGLWSATMSFRCSKQEIQEREAIKKLEFCLCMYWSPLTGSIPVVDYNSFVCVQLLLSPILCWGLYTQLSSSPSLSEPSRWALEGLGTWSSCWLRKIRLLCSDSEDKLSQLKARDRPAGLSLWKDADLLPPFILVQENSPTLPDFSGLFRFYQKSSNTTPFWCRNGN